MIKQQLETEIQHVHRLKELAQSLYQINKEQFDGDKNIKREFKSFFKLIDETIGNLQNPKLSIAMVGTTSAGKSTIVNALSARRIAPMEVAETSAGILRLNPADTVSMHVKKVAHTHWEQGMYDPITDQEAYDKIKGIYDIYKTFETRVAAPNITVNGPLLWHSNPSLLNLPEGLSVEFVDLPGLKTLADNKNLEVIQSVLSKSFCIIAMDFTDVDNNRIELLLNEVQEIVKSMKGNTSSLLFLLNKVDAVMTGEVSVDEKINNLRGLIIKKLNIVDESQIKVLPFISRLLYLAQLSIGNNMYTENIDLNVQYLMDLFKDCSKVFDVALSNNLISPEDYMLCNKIKIDLMMSNTSIKQEDIKKLISICFRLSYGEMLFAELRNRIQESFSTVIIKPIVREVEVACDKLVETVKAYIAVNRKTSMQELLCEKLSIIKMRMFLIGASNDAAYNSINEELQNLKNSAEVLLNNTEDSEQLPITRLITDVETQINQLELRKLGFIDQQIVDIVQSTDEIATSLQNPELRDQQRLVEYFNRIKNSNRSVNAYVGVSDIPTNIQKKLDMQIITPFKKNLEEGTDGEELVKALSENLPARYTRSLVQKYNDMRGLFHDEFKTYGFYSNGDSFRKTTEKQLSDTIVSSIKERYKWMDIRMRDILSRKTNLLFQIDTYQFTNNLEKYIEKEMLNIIDELKININIEGIDISELLLKALNIQKIEVVLPDNLFAFSTPQGKVTVDDKWVRVFSHTETHSCSSDKDVYTSKRVNEYVYKFDNSLGMYNRWNQGIIASVPLFWLVITDWINQSIKSYMNVVKEISLDISELTLTFLENRISAIIAGHQQSDTVYTKMEEMLESMSMCRNNL